MEKVENNNPCKIPSLPNLRTLYQTRKRAGLTRGLLYRSSRPDLLTDDDLSKFKELKIKCIIDFRSKADYEQSSGSKILDQYYKIHGVKLPKRRNYKPGQPVKCFALGNGRSPLVDNTKLENGEKHFLINFFTKSYIWTVFMRAQWYIKFVSLFVLLFDFIFRTGYINFIRLFAKFVLNPMGLPAQYVDIIEMSQRSICTALKLLADKDNIPALINCAHGKDRTGIVAALVLSIMGESEDVIVEDYALSSIGLEPVKDRLHKEIVQKYHWDESFTKANPDTMRNLLQYIRSRYGSLENYLEFIGFGAEEQEKLRTNLGHNPLQGEEELSD